MKKILCIDIGNTNTNFAIVCKEKIYFKGVIPTKKLKYKYAKTLFLKTLKDSSINGISFCSVAPTANKRLREILKSSPNKLPLFQLTEKTNSFIKIVYPKKEEIGHDRIANAIAIKAFHKTPSIVIDYGTATTFDYISNNGYEGGIIAPGLKIMANYLNNQTELLPKFTLNKVSGIPAAFGKSTLEAMGIGISIGFSGMVNNILEHILSKLSTRKEKEIKIISTGGSGYRFEHNWTKDTKYVEHLTLTGLAKAYEASLTINTN